jgi:hypothetical protein
VINFPVEAYNSDKQHPEALTGRGEAMKKPIIVAVAALPCEANRLEGTGGFALANSA